MENLFPKAIAPYAKAWVAFLGVVLTNLATLWANAPDWVAIVGAILTVAAVWSVPNVPTPKPQAPDPQPPAPEPNAGNV